MTDDTNNPTAGDTIGKIGDALEEDAKETGEHIQKGADWVEDKARDTGEAIEDGVKGAVDSIDPDK